MCGQYSAVLYTCLPWLLSKYNINIETALSSIFPEEGGLADPICPYVTRPCNVLRHVTARYKLSFCYYYYYYYVRRPVIKVVAWSALRFKIFIRNCVTSLGDFLEIDAFQILRINVFLEIYSYRERKCAENYTRWHNKCIFKLQSAFW